MDLSIYIAVEINSREKKNICGNFDAFERFLTTLPHWSTETFTCFWCLCDIVVILLPTQKVVVNKSKDSLFSASIITTS